MRSRAAITALILLASCGGGGGSGGGGTPPIPNRAPTITSAATASVPENSAGTVYQANASDPDGNGVSFRIEGVDAARFSITPAGALTFVTPPDFEAPADSDHNNVYQITLVASDGTLESRLDVAITVTNVADHIAARRIFSVGTGAIALAAIPGSSFVFIAERGGRIYSTDPSTPGPGTVYLTVAGLLAPGDPSDFGILNIVAAPDYQSSGLLYVLLTNTAGDVELRRYRRLSSGLGDDASADVILRVPHRTNAGSRLASLGGGLAFGPDNLLYIGIGEGRANDTSPSNSPQDLTNLYGKIIRIDPSRDDFPADADRDYGIPAGNPFSTGAREIFAYGFDNPLRMSFDGANLLIGDAHEPISNIDNSYQEIDLVRPQDAGGNYAFPLNLGPGQNVPPGTIPPAAIHIGTSFSHTGRIIGGYVYHGPIPQFAGLYIFGEVVGRAVLSFPASSISQGTTVQPGAFTVQNPLFVPDGVGDVKSIGVDSSNNLYFVMSGSVYIVELQ